MPIPKEQLERWSKPGASESAERTHKSIRDAIAQFDWAHRSPQVYLQGSYRNATNIRGDSDVDIVVEASHVFYSNLSSEKKKEFGFEKSEYSWSHLYEEVWKALTVKFSTENVKRGKKCLKVKTPHLNGDVVVAISYRLYPDDPSRPEEYTEGITFYVKSENRWIINFPKQHFDRGAEKNERTNGVYKPTVRMFKNARTYLVERCGAPKDLAPSYFLECLLYNVPDRLFKLDYPERYIRILDFLDKADMSKFSCQNGIALLFGSSPEQWSVYQALRLIRNLRMLWDSWD